MCVCVCVRTCVCFSVKDMKMSIMHGCVDTSEYLICLHFMCLYTFDKDTLIVLETLVHEEVSSKTFKMFT